jgi:hypothetical protein
MSLLAGKPEGNGPLKRTRCRWQDNIKMNCRKIRVWGCGLDSSGSGYKLVSGFCEQGNEPSVSIKGGEFLN